MSSAIIASMSRERFQPYLHATSFDRERAFALYLWNAEAGAAFHLPLQGVEIALRNAMSRNLVKHHGEQWWRNSLFRRDSHRKTIEILASTVLSLERRGCSQTSSNVTSALSFGFWAALLRWSEVRRLDHIALRSGMATEAAYLVGLRNRIAHHEPIFRRDLLADHRTTMRLLQAICPATHDWIRPHCRAPALVRAKP